MKMMLRLTLAMVLCAFLGSVILVVVARLTQDARARVDVAVQLKAVAQVLPEFDNRPLEEKVTVAMDGREVIFYRARKDGKVVALAAESSSLRGYGGRLGVLAAVQPDGTLGDILVTAHRETPGLGAAIVTRLERPTLASLFSCCGGKGNGTSRLPRCQFLDQFAGRRLDRPEAFRLRKDGGEVDAVSGATVTSRAVTDAVGAIAAAFAGKKAGILDD